MIAYP